MKKKRSKIMGLNMDADLRAALRALSIIPWVQRGISYLGIKLSDNPQDLLPDNVIPFKNALSNNLGGWKKLDISWWGRLAVIKMKVLPALLFLFQNLIIHIPMKYLDDIQGMLNKFLWKDKKSRVKVKGGIAYPSIRKYYQASRLVAIILWWKQEEIDTLIFEQHGINTPLKELILGDPALGFKKIRNSNITYNAIMRNWLTLHDVFIPGQPPLASFLHHPGFRVASNSGQFGRLEEVGLDKLGRLVTRFDLITAT